MILSQAYLDLRSARTKTVNSMLGKDDSSIEGYQRSVRNHISLTAVVVVAFIQLILAIFALYCLAHCDQFMSTRTTIILAALLFIPDLGALISIAVIAYYYLKCKLH